MKRIVLLALISAIMINIWSAPPAPGSWWQEDMSFVGASEVSGIDGRAKDRELPQNILILRAAFNDVGFDMDPEYPPGNPDIIPHDDAYFERFMFHLGAYWHDASQGAYSITEDNYTLYPEVFTLSRDMSYYGDDELSQERISEMLVELLDMGDAAIDYSAYDSYIVFHAGAGQESDVSGANTADLWTTFVTRATLQEGLDPDNDEFPGLEYDGKMLKEFVIVPESEKQPDIQQNDPIFGVLGVFCHEFGRQLGLPTLYDNQSSNGKSAGIGNYGVMGTGLWNAAGFVPPLPCAWCRIYMGWSDYVEISEDTAVAELTYPMNYQSGQNTIYKVLINEDEYFLLENRQQNPDGSVFINAADDTLATFSFEIVENQQYYPEGHAYAGQPYFDFMHNTYAGCEWDFYLPGYGEGDALDMDGSGICIWHVDEIVMREKFNLEEEINVPNGVEEHKAIALEEADHNLEMNLYGYYGAMDDTYRAGNNDYFGYAEHNGLPWFPTAESYYGGIQLEIMNISQAANEMSFDVSYEWSLATGYSGINTLPAAFLDFDSETKRLFYPMPDGELYMWEDNLLVAQETILRDTIPQCWSWLESQKKILIPAQTGRVASLHVMDQDLNSTAQILFPDCQWSAPPMVIEAADPTETIIALGLTHWLDEDEYYTDIRLLDSDFEEMVSVTSAEQWSITGNMMCDGENIYSLLRRNNESYYMTYTLNLNDYSWSNDHGSIIYSNEVNLTHGIMVKPGASSSGRIIFTSCEGILYQLDLDCESAVNIDPELPFIANSYPSFADLDKNGTAELIFGGENSFVVFDATGAISYPSGEITSPDSTGLCAGAIPVDIDGDGYYEILGNMSQNRLCVWENRQHNDWRMMRDYPVTYGSRGRVFPLISEGVIYLPADNGRVYRDINHPVGDLNLPVEYVNLARTGYIDLNEEENVYETEDIFVDAETYVYPNPYSQTFNGTIVNGSMQEGKIGIRFMVTQQTTVKMTIYDIAGHKVDPGNISYQQTNITQGSIDNYLVEPYFAVSYLLDAKRLSSGVYVVKLEAEKETKLIKFAIEK